MFVLLCANVLENGMYLSLLPSAMGKIVGQTAPSGLVQAIGLKT